MQIAIAAVGRLKLGPERDLVERYVTRFDQLSRRVGLSPLKTREVEESRARRPEDRRDEEARSLLAELAPGSRVLALDETGKTLSSSGFASQIAAARDAAAPALVLVIGGPDGLGAGVRAAADATLAFGQMTWPHQLVRVMLAEQLYRAATILAGHPYHRA